MNWKYKEADQAISNEVLKELEGETIPHICSDCDGDGVSNANGEKCDGCDGSGEKLNQY